MKALKPFLALAAACSFAALPAFTQQQKKSEAQPQQQATAQPSASPSALPAVPLKESKNYTERREYLLGPADVVEMRVFNDPQFNSEIEVDPDGNITVPFVEEPIRAQCRSVEMVRKEVTAAVAKFIRQPRVSLRVKEQKSHKPVVIYGAVRNPSLVEMRRPVRLLQLISTSYGITEQQSGTIQIIHTEPPQCPDIEPAEAEPVQTDTDAAGLPFSIYKVDDLRQGKPEANPYLRPGDIVYVAEASPVYVVGNVATPANLYLREGTTLTRVIAQVGGAKDANEEKLRIYRKKPNQPQEVLTINYKAIKQGKEADPVLQPYDIIEVPKNGVFSPAGISKILQGVATQSVGLLGTSGVTRIIY